MKRSEVLQELLDSYHFQHGRRANRKLVQKAEHMLHVCKNEEREVMRNEERNCEDRNM